MDKLQQIFGQQRTVMARFHTLELDWDNRIPPPFDVLEYVVDMEELSDCYHAQRYLRQLAWYCIEEVGEVMQCDPRDPTNLHTEMADVLHFLIEIAICVGIDYGQVMAIPSGSLADTLDHMFSAVSSNRICVPGDATLEFIRALTMAMHELKFKPWKQDPKPTNANNLRVRVIQCLYLYVEMAIAHGLTSVTLHHFYMHKAIINHERIDDGV